MLEEVEDVDYDLGPWKRSCKVLKESLVGKNRRLEQGNQQSIIRMKVRG